MLYFWTCNIAACCMKSFQEIMCSGGNITLNLDDHYKYMWEGGEGHKAVAHMEKQLLSCILSDVKLLHLDCRGSTCMLMHVLALFLWFTKYNIV